MYNNDYFQSFNYNNFKKNKINWSNILNNTQKTLSIINQIIPVIYQIKPMYDNAKTIFKVFNVVNNEKVVKPFIKEIPETKKEEKNDSSPTFFL